MNEAEARTLTLTEFLLARIAEDAERNKRRRFLRNYHLSVLVTRHEAVATATRWLSIPGSERAGEHWLRSIGRLYKRHPDYRKEWKP